ncbi:MAG: CDP-2,3-bis-(O-geranylgeranyl)-sn-glycerol synthase [Halobacteriales archaeon]|nr:CDP-2,3-bis-(O-geranylgeranyl)-sn-glycerol synthase [Halobacteriales archaeon]
MSVVQTVVVALWLMLPAYVPNNAAVVLGGGMPVDFGREWRGDRILGDGKTWRGGVAGVGAGFGLALVQTATVTQGFVPEFLPMFEPVSAFGLALGAILGDMGASFLKRRTGRERGAPFPGVDQLDFVVGAFVVTALLAPGWFFEKFTVEVVVAVLVLTPLLHVTTNLIAYRLGLKDEPW